MLSSRCRKKEFRQPGLLVPTAFHYGSWQVKYPMPLDRTTIDKLNARLKRAYGPRPLRPNGDPVAELILTILSQATNDRNRDRAFAALAGPSRAGRT